MKKHLEGFKKVIKYPFKVFRIEDGWWFGNNFYVKNIETDEIWRYYKKLRDANEFAWFANGNIGEYINEQFI